MRLDQVVEASSQRLSAQGFEAPRRAAQDLVLAVLELDRAMLVVQHDLRVSQAHAKAVLAFSEQWQPHMSLGRLLGRTAFRDQVYEIGPATLEPRADTGALVELALEWAQARGTPPRHVLDLGTGSGIIGLELGLAWPETQLVLSDISKQALSVARRNAMRLGLVERTQLLESNWFDQVEGRFDLLISNPPYIAEAYALDPSVADYDPHTALFAGPEGLDAYRQIFAAAHLHLAEQGVLLLEVGYDQAARVGSLARKQGWQPFTARQDLGGHWRALAFSHGSIPLDGVKKAWPSAGGLLAFS